MYPEDVDPQSGCRLPLPRREQLDDAGQRIYDSLADPEGGTIRGLRGPGGILLHSPELSRHARPLNRYLRHEEGLGGRVRELAILTTARELDSQLHALHHTIRRTPVATVPPKAQFQLSPDRRTNRRWPSSLVGRSE
jgi:4-carboxymuconolactone decarboxylase